MAEVAGKTILTLNGWAAVTNDDALLGYYPTREEAESVVRKFHSAPPIPTSTLIPGMREPDDTHTFRCPRCGNPHFINDMCSECGTHIDDARDGR